MSLPIFGLNSDGTGRRFIISGSSSGSLLSGFDSGGAGRGLVSTSSPGSLRFLRGDNPLLLFIILLNHPSLRLGFFALRCRFFVRLFPFDPDG